MNGKDGSGCMAGIFAAVLAILAAGTLYVAAGWPATSATAEETERLRISTEAETERLRIATAAETHRMIAIVTAGSVVLLGVAFSVAGIVAMLARRPVTIVVDVGGLTSARMWHELPPSTTTYIEQRSKHHDHAN